LALLCALQHIVETWDENFNFLSNVTPRSITSSTRGINLESIKYVVCSKLLLGLPNSNMQVS